MDEQFQAPRIVQKVFGGWAGLVLFFSLLAAGRDKSTRPHSTHRGV